MPWQQYVVDVALELAPDNTLFYSEIDLTVQRQAGKTTVLLPVLVHRSIAHFLGGNLDVGPQRQTVAYTAQTRNDARKKWKKEFNPLLEASPFRNKFTTRWTNGSEGWDWANGSTFDLMATMEKSGHGDTLDLGIIDEAFAQIDNRLEVAMEPATATRQSPQLWIFSTAGESAMKSPYLWSKVEAGRKMITAGDETSTAYFEWSVGPDDDPDDLDIVAARHPAVGYTITKARLGQYREKALRNPDEGIAGFRRSYCNMWESTETQGHLPIDHFDACAMPADFGPALDQRVAFAVDVAPDRSRSAVVAAGYRDGRPVVELIADRAGTDWLPLYLKDRHRKQLGRGPSLGVSLDVGAAAGALASDIETAGVPVHRMTTRDMCHAAGRLFDAVKDHRMAWRSIEQQAALRVAAVGAVKRDVGESWLFDRKSAVVNICPIVAASEAMWALETIDDETTPAPVFAY